MEYRRLGRTGHRSSVLIFGGAALSDVSEAVADRSVEQAMEAGINHLDTAADYGRSETLLGRRLPEIRDRIFLSTKTGDRTAEGAHASIRRSLERLRVDRVDLIQLHAVCTVDDLDRATGAGGALEAAVRATDEGLVSAVGITGHGMAAPAVHLEALRRFPFDTVLTPWNWRLARFPDYRRDFDSLAAECRRLDVGLMLIKSVARHLWRTGEARRTTWYEPHEDPRTIEAAVAFALGADGATGICTPGDVSLLPMLVAAERRRSGWSAEAIDEHLAGVEDYEPPFIAAPGRHVPDWLEPVAGLSPGA